MPDERDLGADPPLLHEPWLVAAWPGLGSVGLIAVSTLARGLEGAVSLGELGAEELFEVTHVGVRDGLLLSPRRPRSFLVAWKAPPGGRDLVILVGEAQPREQAWGLAEAVAAVAERLGVRRVVTFAALGVTITPRSTPRVLVAASDQALLDEAQRARIEPLAGGEIGGLNGLLIGAAAAREIPGVCLLGEFPYFTGALPNPRAALQLLRAFARLTGVQLDLRGLQLQAERVADELEALQDRLCSPQLEGFLVGETREPEEPEPELEPASEARIEALFAAATADRSRWRELKAELDRLGVFPVYEDRFLNLFRRGE